MTRCGWRTQCSVILATQVILKLNGGLGTGMGLDKAKSLLQVTGALAREHPTLRELDLSNLMTSDMH
eukprot:898482-Amphidinium_carterae.1